MRSFPLLSSRAMRVANTVGEFQEHFEWLNHTFLELCKQEAHKAIRDVMGPVHSLLKEDDTINHAIYIMFKENVRQPLVFREGGEIVGVVNLMQIFTELLETVGPECYVDWENI